MSENIGVERIFPLESPLIESITVNKVGKVRRAKLYLPQGPDREKSPHQRKKILRALHTIQKSKPAQTLLFLSVIKPLPVSAMKKS